MPALVLALVLAPIDRVGDGLRGRSAGGSGNEDRGGEDAENDGRGGEDDVYDDMGDEDAENEDKGGEDENDKGGEGSGAGSEAGLRDWRGVVSPVSPLWDMVMNVVWVWLVRR